MEMLAETSVLTTATLYKVPEDIDNNIRDNRTISAKECPRLIRTDARPATARRWTLGTVRAKDAQANCHSSGVLVDARNCHSEGCKPIAIVLASQWMF
jgi:hypothetical protein